MKTNPADKVERWPLERLVPYAKNSRTHSDAQVAQIAASIREWGWTTPILVDEAGGIIAGHGRLQAARRLQMAEVPVVVASGWSEAQKRAYVIADNKLALNAGWDNELLALELGYPRDAFLIFFTALIIPLVFWRWRNYVSIGMHYYLIDLCYFSTALILYNIWFDR